MQTRNEVGFAEEMLEKLPKTEKFNKRVWRSWHQVKSLTPLWQRCSGCPSHRRSSGRVTYTLPHVLKNLVRASKMRED